MPEHKLLKIGTVTEMVELSRSQIWRLTRAGDFPAPRKIGEHGRRWLAADIQKWIMSREVMRAAG
jgi:predicted DNA-binding transcriptional regulator AlpA